MPAGTSAPERRRARGRRAGARRNLTNPASRGAHAGSAHCACSRSARPSRSSASAPSDRHSSGYVQTRLTQSRELRTRHRGARAHACGVASSRTVHSLPSPSTNRRGNSSSAGSPWAGNTWPSVSTLEDTTIPAPALVRWAASSPSLSNVCGYRLEGSCRAPPRRTQPSRALRDRPAGCRSASARRPSRGPRGWSA